MADSAPGDRLQSLGMLASALAGRAVAVAELQASEPSWTDGQTIYVDPSAQPRAKLEAIAIHASMIAAGSLDPDVMRLLVRHPRLARRYLAVEGHRALVSNGDLLPRVLASVGNRDIASRSHSPAASLSLAAGRATIDDPAPGFGEMFELGGEIGMVAAPAVDEHDRIARAGRLLEKERNAVSLRRLHGSSLVTCD